MLDVRTLRIFLALVLAPLPAAAWAQEENGVDTTDVVDLADLGRPAAIERRLRHMLADHETELARVVRNGTVRRGPLIVAAADSVVGHLLVVGGDASVGGRLLGNLVVVDGDARVRPGGVVSGDILVFNGEADSVGGTVGGTVRVFDGVTPAADPLSGEKRPRVSGWRKVTLTLGRLAGTIGTFFTLLVLGFAFLLFTRRKLEVVAATGSHTFARSTVAGFVGQILLLPTFGVLVVGLVVSIVGILLLPFAVVAYLLLAGVGTIGGYLATAHAIGETYTRRRAAEGTPGASSGYRQLAIGLALLATPWLAWSLFGWVPVAGALLWVGAFLVTWLAVSVGFGAMLLSRGGGRITFTGWER